ncbi:unnamed protein product [Symbiodinium natans]|uniref:Uncharacterized protein n=1 Tax=Symbiodinium natans TaxID=878477 RepID=A0A812QWZ9_9DINO|nr:unnamed protein product [Symbiodinium natans]
MAAASEGPSPCVPEDLRTYMACIVAASCIVQAAVPAHVSMEVYAMILEQVTRFEEITWPLLRDALLHEEGGNSLAVDALLPEAYICDGSEHTSLRQLTSMVGTEHAATMSMALDLKAAAAASHQIMNSHAVNASLDETIDKLQQAWHPVCQKLGCDHTNFWDIYLQHHKHALALLETKHAGLLRSDIKLRFHLEQRVQRLLGPESNDYSFIEKYARHGQEHHSSHQVFHAYHDSARASMLEFAKSVVGSLSYERAKRLVNLHKLADIEKEAARKERSAERSASSHANEKMQLSLLEEVEDEGEGAEAFWDRRRRRRRRRRIFEVVVQVVETVVEAVARPVTSALACAGQGGNFVSTGYTRSLNGNVAWSIGLAGGSSDIMKDILNGQGPLGWISLGAGFSVGSTTDVWWAGAGFGGSIGCNARYGWRGKSRGSCTMDLTVSTLACGNVPTSSSACPFGRNFAGMTCSSSGGYFVSIMCCSFDLTNGGNTCR